MSFLNLDFKVSKRDILLTAKHLFLIGRERMKKGADQGKLVEIVKRSSFLTEKNLFVLSDSFRRVKKQTIFYNFSIRINFIGKLK